MNMAMNLMYAVAVAVALGVGGWLAVAGRIEVGTVVAVVSSLGRLNDPWGDLVNWAREWSVDSVQYRLFADAVNGKGLGNWLKSYGRALCVPNTPIQSLRDTIIIMLRHRLNVLRRRNSTSDTRGRQEPTDCSSLLYRPVPS